jgi:MFS family permease
MYASGMVTGGRLGDLFGYRRMFMIGVVSFAAASLLCGLAQSPGELVAARLLQGLTGAAMVPHVLALITATFPAAERSRALAWFGVTMGIGFVSGQILGGGLIEADIFGLGWRAIFLVNVPGRRAAADRGRPRGAARLGAAPAPAGPARRRGGLGQHRAGPGAADAWPGPGPRRGPGPRSPRPCRCWG